MTLELPRKEDLEFARNHECSPQLYYSVVFGRFYRKKLQMLLDLLPKEKTGKILEIGFGSGIALKELSKRAEHVHGIDVHDLSASVQTVLDKNSIQNVRLHQHNIFVEPFTADHNFDYVFSSSVFEHLQKDAIRVALRHVSECLKNDGYFLIGFPLKTAPMNFAFKAYETIYKRFLNIYDFSLEHDHPSGQDEIMPLLRERFEIEEERYFINRFVKLYVVLKCKKKI